MESQDNKKNEKIIHELNNLLEINNDRLEGYSHATNETDDSDLKSLFAQLAETSQECQQELIAEIKKLGGAPIEGTRITGKLYRAWMDVKAALTDKNRKAILNSCETGEEVALKNYKDALENNTIGSELYSVIARQYTMIKGDHEMLKKLRDILVEA